ncbi:MAG: cob(I)yrinic acid a,c-diamide adenosyltransferase [Desulfovermiculus sp.]
MTVADVQTWKQKRRMEDIKAMKKGLVMVFTGNGKGKTTSALGMTLRSAGHGLRTCFIQFIKGSWKYGELEAMNTFGDLIDFHVMGRGFTWKSEDMDKDIQTARQGWEFALEAMHSSTYHVLVLDEFTYLMTLKMLGVQEVLNALSRKPEDLHVLITGRDAPRELINHADLVTTMQAVKHPYQAGIQAQKGVEF